jgi:hypothetical protein
MGAGSSYRIGSVADTGPGADYIQAPADIGARVLQIAAAWCGYSSGWHNPSGRVDVSTGESAQ